MNPQTAAHCPLQVFVSATSDTLLSAALDFIGCIHGIDAGITVVPPEKVPELVRRGMTSPAELIVLAQDEDAGGQRRERLDAVAMAMDSSVPVMVLRAPAGAEGSFPPFKRVLVPLDGSARAAEALPLATHIARGANLPVQFVMVIDPSRIIPPAFAYDPDSWTLVTELKETAHWALKQAEEQLMRSGIEVESTLLYGPVNTCLQEAIQPSDLVIMTTHGSGKSASKIGSVAARVLEMASGPVILHRGHGQREIVVNGYEACSWVEPLSRRTGVTR